MKLLLIDGSYYAYRSFHAIRGLTNSRGEPTNAIFGFAKTVRRMIKDLRPDLAAVCLGPGVAVAPDGTPAGVQAAPLRDAA